MKTKINDELLKLMGQVVFDFGFMENLLPTVLLVLSRNTELSSILLLPSNTVSQNLEILRRLSHSNVNEKYIEHWNDAINDIQDLFEIRNKIFHGMIFEENSKLKLGKLKKGKGLIKDHWIDTEFDITIVKDMLSRMVDRSRQFIDFVSDFRNNGISRKEIASQNTHPYLEI